MFASRIGSILATIVLLVGCAATSDEANDCSPNHEGPIFQLSFIPGMPDRGFIPGMPDREPIVDIIEDSSGATIQVNWSQSRYRVADTSRYLRLKKRILSSAQWEERASNPLLPFVSTGPSRDRISVFSGGDWLFLQGRDVPRGWRQELIGLVSSGKGVKLGEQDGAGQAPTRPESK